MFLKDREGRYLLVNEAAAQTAGLSVEDIIGHFDYEFMPPHVAAQTRAVDLQVMEHGCRMEIEETGGFAGAERTMLVGKTPYFDAARTVQGVIGIARDITERKEAEETLRLSEATQRALINAIPDLMFRFNREGIFLAFDTAQRDQLASPPDFFIGKPVSAVLPPPIAEQALKQIELVLQTGEMQVFEYEYVLSTGSIGVFEARFVLCDQDQVLAIVRDITERKHMERTLRESEVRQHAILHGTTDAVYLKDRDGRYLLVNPAVSTILQRSVDELVGRTDWDLFPPAEAEAFSRVDQQVMATGQSVEVENNTMIGCQQRTFLTVKAPYRCADGKIDGVIGIGRDITERKRQEQIKDDFLALASHELKTPLAAIVGYIHLLQRWSAKQGFDERVNKALTAMQHEGSRLDRLVNDLLDVSRIQTGRLQLHLRTIDIQRFLSQVIDTLQFAIPDHVLIVHLPQCTAHCNVDQQRLEQVISNLLTNAAKYSYEAAPIFVNFKVEQQFVEIAVRDTGLGIPAADLPYIFNRFYQVQRPTRESRPGMGLGLFITQQIVQQHGGTIEVESWEHGGSRFVVRLPRTSSTPTETTLDATSTHSPTA